MYKEEKRNKLAKKINRRWLFMSESDIQWLFSEFDKLHAEEGSK